MVFLTAREYIKDSEVGSSAISVGAPSFMESWSWEGRAVWRVWVMGVGVVVILPGMISFSAQLGQGDLLPSFSGANNNLAVLWCCVCPLLKLRFVNTGVGCWNAWAEKGAF